MQKKKVTRYVIRTVIILFVVMNLVAALHAYKFTHFSTDKRPKTKNPEQIRFSEKIQALVLGINNPRPVNKSLPAVSYTTVTLNSNKTLACWLIPADTSKGTVIIFHGYSGEKSSMLDKAYAFRELGYTTLLVDFMGSGGSEGNQTTLGFHEAVEVKDAFEFIKSRGEKNIFLFGTSMGAASIMKAQKDHQLDVKGLILECPFGTMLETVEARFSTMHVPSFPMANLLVFWGGVENGFNAFAHNPADYASRINCPTLLLYGDKDLSVSAQETNTIYKNLKGKKVLKTYPECGHENYLNLYREKWISDVSSFLDSVNEHTL